MVCVLSYGTSFMHLSPSQASCQIRTANVLEFASMEPKHSAKSAAITSWTPFPVCSHP